MTATSSGLIEVLAQPEETPERVVFKIDRVHLAVHLQHFRNPGVAHLECLACAWFEVFAAERGTEILGRLLEQDHGMPLVVDCPSVARNDEGAIAARHRERRVPFEGAVEVLGSLDEASDLGHRVPEIREDLALSHEREMLEALAPKRETQVGNLLLEFFLLPFPRPIVLLSGQTTQAIPRVAKKILKGCGVGGGESGALKSVRQVNGVPKTFQAAEVRRGVDQEAEVAERGVIREAVEASPPDQ